MKPLSIWVISAYILVMPAPRGNAVAQDESDRAGDILKRYESFVDTLRTIRLDASETIREKGGKLADWTWTSTSQSTFARAKDRWRLRVNEVGVNYYDGRMLPYHGESENTFDGKSNLIVNRDDRTVRDLAGLQEGAGQSRLKFGLAGRVETNVSAEIDADKPKSREAYAIQNLMNPLYGYLPADEMFIKDVMKQTSPLSVRRETIDGRPCRVLECRSRFGVLTLWLDPATDYSPVRIHQKKTENDYAGKTMLRSMKAPGLTHGSEPDLPLRGIEYAVNFKSARSGGRTIIAGYTREDRLIYEGGADYRRKFEVVMEDVAFDPKAEDVEPTLPIKDETPVHVRNAPGIRAKWANNRLIFDYDKPTVVNLNAHWTSERDPSLFWRRYLPLAVLGAVTIASGWIWWRRRSLTN